MGQELSTAKGPRKSSRASGRALPKSKPLPEPTALPAPARRSPKRQARGRKRVTIKQELAQEPSQISNTPKTGEAGIPLPSKDELAHMRKLLVQAEKALRPEQHSVDTKELHKQVAKKLAQLDDKRGFEHVKPRKRLPSYALGRIVNPPTATGGYEGSDTEDDDLYYSSSGHSTALSSVRSVIATGAADAPITLW